MFLAYTKKCLRGSCHQGASHLTLLKLQQAVEMPLVQVWLGLLLNGFEVEQRGEFYDTERVWILH